MQIARVLGPLVATRKHPKLEAGKLLLIQPLGLDDTPRGRSLLAIDSVGAAARPPFPSIRPSRPSTRPSSASSTR
jgi:microcompartment protein CcmK/EutM